MNHIYAAPNSDVFYKSKRGTHSEPSSLKPTRKELQLSLSSLLPWALVGHSWWVQSINAHCFPFKFLLRGESSCTLGRERKRSVGASSLQTSPLLVTHPLISWSSLLSATILPGRLSAFETFSKVYISKLQQEPRRRNSAHDLGIPITTPEWFLFK